MREVPDGMEHAVVVAHDGAVGQRRGVAIGRLVGAVGPQHEVASRAVPQPGYGGADIELPAPEEARAIHDVQQCDGVAIASDAPNSSRRLPEVGSEGRQLHVGVARVRSHHRAGEEPAPRARRSSERISSPYRRGALRRGPVLRITRHPVVELRRRALRRRPAADRCALGSSSGRFARIARAATCGPGIPAHTTTIVEAGRLSMVWLRLGIDHTMPARKSVGSGMAECFESFFAPAHDVWRVGAGYALRLRKLSFSPTTCARARLPRLCSTRHLRRTPRVAPRRDGPNRHRWSGSVVGRRGPPQQSGVESGVPPRAVLASPSLRGTAGDVTSWCVCLGNSFG